MRPELFHRWYEPMSELVIDFLKENRIGHLVDFVDVDDDEEFAMTRLHQICGHVEVPCLVVNLRPILGPDEIIQWFKENLLRSPREVRAS